MMLYYNNNNNNNINDHADMIYNRTHYSVDHLFLLSTVEKSSAGTAAAGLALFFLKPTKGRNGQCYFNGSWDTFFFTI